MGNTANIVIGLLAALFGLAMIVWIIPAQTAPSIFASVPSGFYSDIGCVLMIASGLALALSGFLAARERIDLGAAWRQFATFAVAALFLSAMTLAMPHIGFVPTGIPATLAVALLMGVRRPLSLVLLSVVVPVAIWFAFDQMLGRPLP